MSLLPTLTEDKVDEKVATTFTRLREALGTSTVPEAFLPLGHVPTLVQDAYMNYKKFVLGAGKLESKRKALVGLGAAAALKNPTWIKLLADHARSVGADDQAIADAVAVAATCAMYNVFFKFRDISGSSIFEGMLVGLRAHTFAGVTLDERTVELINVVVSDINGCKPCTSGHVAKARDLGASDEEILESIQVAATIAAGATFLSAIG